MHAYTCTFAGFGRRALLIATLVLALAVVGTAVSASASTSYSGKAKSGGKLTFHTTATKVIGFKTSVSALCVSVSSGASHLYVYPVLLQAPSKLTNGRFKITFSGESSTHITVTGKVSGSSASGKIDVRYSKTLGTTSTGLLDIGACSAKTTWTARKT